VPEVISTHRRRARPHGAEGEVQVVTGYPGKSDVRSRCCATRSILDSQATPIFEQSVRPSVKEGQALPLFAQGFMDGDELVRDPAARDVPSVARSIAPFMASSRRGRPGNLQGVARAIVTAARFSCCTAMRRRPPAWRCGRRSTHGQGSRYLKVAESVLEGYGFSTGERLEANIAAIGRWMRPPSAVAGSAEPRIPHEIPLAFEHAVVWRLRCDPAAG